MNSGKFSAAASLIGYFYQVRIALLWSLGRLKTSNSFKISIETLDDVTFSDETDNVIELLQTKHHVDRTGNLTDASEDLWKTLRIWLEQSKAGEVPDDSIFCIVTTGAAPLDSAASFLKTEDRAAEKAIVILESIARTSTNKDNKAAYEIFLSISKEDLSRIFERILVLDKNLNIESLDEGLKQEVFWAVDRKYHVSFLDRLEGWWFRRVINHLTSKDSKAVEAIEIEAQMSDLREQFKLDSLPIDVDLINFDLDAEAAAEYSNDDFVKQLQLVNVAKERIMAAVRDYYRAFEQRSRWLRDDLLMISELKTYEKKLVEEWQLIFLAMKDDLEPAALEQVKIKAGRDVLKWAEACRMPVRSNVNEPFISRGSLHMLADELRVGWHPDFKDKLKKVLGIAEAEL